MENMELWTSGVCRPPVKCAVYIDEGLNEEPNWDFSGAVNVPYIIKFENTTTVLYHKATMTISWSMTRFNWPERQHNSENNTKIQIYQTSHKTYTALQILTSHFKWKVGPPCNSRDLGKQLIMSCNKYLLVGTVHDRKQTTCTTWPVSRQPKFSCMCLCAQCTCSWISVI